jgi:hypothetical protein
MQHRDLQVKELEFTSFAGEVYYKANLGDGTLRRVEQRLRANS